MSSIKVLLKDEAHLVKGSKYPFETTEASQSATAAKTWLRCEIHLPLEPHNLLQEVIHKLICVGIGNNGRHFIHLVKSLNGIDFDDLL